ncbi:MAG TPA: DinB family protein [Gemmatimonadales bacterium]
MPSPVLDLFAWNLQPAPGQRNWHGGPSPVTALRVVTAAEAAWRPGTRRKSIWALVLHIAYWKYTVRRHLEPEPMSRFPRSPSNWPTPPASGDEKSWSQDVALLKEQHERLIQAAREVPASALDRIPPAGRRWTYGQLLLGIAAHDAYHTGQIQLMKKLWAERKALFR